MCAVFHCSTVYIRVLTTHLMTRTVAQWTLSRIMKLTLQNSQGVYSAGKVYNNYSSNISSDVCMLSISSSTINCNSTTFQSQRSSSGTSHFLYVKCGNTHDSLTKLNKQQFQTTQAVKDMASHNEWKLELQQWEMTQSVLKPQDSPLDSWSSFCCTNIQTRNNTCVRWLRICGPGISGEHSAEQANLIEFRAISSQHIPAHTPTLTLHVCVHVIAVRIMYRCDTQTLHDCVQMLIH